MENEQYETNEIETEVPKKKKKKGLKIVAILLAVILFFEVGYCVAIFTDIPPFGQLRQIYIETAMSTMSHRWLAMALIPGDIVQDVIDDIEAAKDAQMGVNSSWDNVAKDTDESVAAKSPVSGFSKDQAAELLSQLALSTGLSGEVKDFFALFHELDQESVQAYVEEHPEAVADGWSKFHVNEAGLEDAGTTMKTKQGDQVLAINAEHGLLAIRITGSGYRGVMVIGKDPSRLKLAAAPNLGSMGSYAGDIAERNNALVAITGAGFGDMDNVGEGGDLSGAAMHSGSTYGSHYPWGYKRLELHTDNRLYITDAHTGFGENCTDAMEWTPALIVDGEIVVTAADGYTAMNPRCCVGQTKDEAIVLLTIEGRFVDSIGTDAGECAQIMARYDCYQAMNVDGGSSAIMWYEGEYITRCSNGNYPGRHLPDAWVYCSEPVPDP